MTEPRLELGTEEPSEQPEPGSGDLLRGRRWSLPQRTRLYASSKTHARSRRATDVVLIATCTAGLVLFGGLASPPSAFEQALINLVKATPSFLDVVWRIGAGLLTTWGLLLIVASILRWRLDIFRDHVVALVLGGGIATVVERLVGPESSKSVWDSIISNGPPATLTSLRLAVLVATTAVASPHLARPFRTASRWLAGFGAFSLVMLQTTTPTGAVLGVLCGVSAAALVHLVFGSSGGRPSLSEVRRGLDELGVEVLSLSEATRQHAGVYQLDGVAEDGSAVVVRVYGRDAWDTQLLAKGWRALWYRDAEALTLTRAQQVEHEGFVTLLASRNGVPVQDVVRAGRTQENDALIVMRTRGVPLSGDGSSVNAEALESTWDTVMALETAGFAHGDLGPGRFRIDGSEVVLDGLAGVSMAATGDQHSIDLAQLLITCALLAGPDAALAVAARRLGADGLAQVLPYLQRAACGPQLRSALAASDLDLDTLRSLAAAEAGVDEPKLAQIRRMSTARLVRVGLYALACYFLISTLVGVDMQQLADALRDASLPILFVALLFGQVPRFAQAESTRSACPRPIPYGPMVLLQFAITFVNLAIPSTAARVAVNVRFFQRNGIPGPSAVTIGVLDSVCGFVVQITILLCVLVFGFGNVDFSFNRPENVHSGDLLHLLAVVLGLAVLAAIVAMLLPKPRNWVLDRVRPWIHEVLETASVLRSPSRLARVLGANLLAETLFATTLGIVLAAFGYSLPLATLLVINVSVALFAGLMPVPGGIGVTEGAIVVGLTAAGIPQTIAFGTAIGYRVCTFYLPPIWGAAAFHRLERNGYL